MWRCHFLKHHHSNRLASIAGGAEGAPHPPVLRSCFILLPQVEPHIFSYFFVCFFDIIFNVFLFTPNSYWPRFHRLKKQIYPMSRLWSPWLERNWPKRKFTEVILWKGWPLLIKPLWRPPLQRKKSSFPILIPFLWYDY